MTRKNLAKSETGTPLAVRICFLVALVVILIYIIVPDRKESVKEEKKEIYQPEVKIVVNNGCAVTDLAQSVSQVLLGMGINVVTWGNIENPNCIYEETMIIIRRKNKDTKKKLEYFSKLTGIQKSNEIEKENSKAEFELILGKDYFLYFKI